jgi:hypothetical protein
MWSALTVLLAVQAPGEAAATPNSDTIIVVASRLERVKFNLSVNRVSGEMKCRIGRSSGNTAVDGYMCDVAKYCAKTAPKNRQAIEQCIGEQKQNYLAHYVRQRK